jgi:hypothetical protein
MTVEKRNANTRIVKIAMIQMIFEKLDATWKYSNKKYRRPPVIQAIA